MDSNEVQLRLNPEVKANPISNLFILWIIPLLKTGAKKDLNLEDLSESLPEDKSETLGNVVEREWNKEETRAEGQDRPAKLWRVVRSIIWKKYSLVGLGYCFDELVLRTLQPLVLRNFIKTFREESDTPNLRRDQFLYAGALVLVTFGHAIFFQKMIGIIIHIGMKMRLGISSLIYRKILKLRKSDSEQANVGRLVNLLSSDVGRLDQSFHLFHFFWIAPIQLAIFSYLLWNELGVASLGGVGCILFLLPIQVLVGRFSMYFRTRIARRTDERGRFLNEIIGGIRLIKMYAWEKPFGTVVSRLRRTEIKFIRRHLYLRGMYVSVHSISSKLIPFCALILYVLLGNTLTADKAFFSIAVFNTILQAIMNRIPNAASQLGELMASLNRIEQFMLSKDNSKLKRDHYKENLVQNGSSMKHHTPSNPSSEVPEKENSEPSVIMDNYSASWSDSQNTLKNLKVNLKGNKLVMVVGHVGSGKSSFLNAILSELPFTTGTSTINGRFTYASQEAWIFPATFRQNILFGLPMEK